MDWFLGVSTLIVNANLGWAKGAPWAWLVHALNASLWIWYSYKIGQYGFVLLSVVTVILDIVCAWRSHNNSGG